MPMIHTRRPMKVAKYKCAKKECGAEDTARLYLEETPAIVINCWKCHAGMQMPLENMMANRVGMFLVGPPQIEVEEDTQLTEGNVLDFPVASTEGHTTSTGPTASPTASPAVEG